MTYDTMEKRDWGELMKINIAMLEDEISERLQTEQLLERFFQEVNIEYELFCYENLASFTSEVGNAGRFHLLLLDILMPEGENGMDLAHQIRKVNQDVAIMFITKTADFAINGYEVNAIDYVLKPLSYAEFSLKLKRAIRYIVSHIARFLVLNTKEGAVRINEKQIYYLEVIKHYITVYTSQGEYVVRGSLKEMSEGLSNTFAKPSQSYYVNMRHVEKVTKNDVIVHGVTIPISRTHKVQFLLDFTQYTGGGTL